MAKTEFYELSGLIFILGFFLFPLPLYMFFKQIDKESYKSGHYNETQVKERRYQGLRQAPGWFKVPTPLGSYNTDWAVLVEKDDTERLTSWSSPRVGYSLTIYAIKNAPRSTAARRTSRRWKRVARTRCII